MECKNWYRCSHGSYLVSIPPTFEYMDLTKKALKHVLVSPFFHPSCLLTLLLAMAERLNLSYPTSLFRSQLLQWSFSSQQTELIFSVIAHLGNWSKNHLRLLSSLNKVYMWFKGGDGTSYNGWVAFVPSLHFELHELVEEITEPTFHLLTTHPDLETHPFQRPSNGCNRNFWSTCLFWQYHHLSTSLLHALLEHNSLPTQVTNATAAFLCLLLFQRKPEEKKEIQKQDLTTHLVTRASSSSMCP